MTLYAIRAWNQIQHLLCQHVFYNCTLDAFGLVIRQNLITLHLYAVLLAYFLSFWRHLERFKGDLYAAFSSYSWTVYTESCCSPVLHPNQFQLLSEAISLFNVLRHVDMVQTTCKLKFNLSIRIRKKGDLSDFLLLSNCRFTGIFPHNYLQWTAVVNAS